VQRELAAIAEVGSPWWLLAGAVALAETRTSPAAYLSCDATPDADTLMGYRAPPPHNVVTDAIDRAYAAQTALRELDGTLPDQPLAVTIDRASLAPSKLDVAAFSCDRGCLVAQLDDPRLATELAAMLRGTAPRPWHGARPFVCVSIGDEPIETARHGHRRAWVDGAGPWLGLGRAGELAVVSTCHLVVDGYGHARITARVAELCAGAVCGPPMPWLAPVPGAIPLAVAWREVASPTSRVIPLAYKLGQILHRTAGAPDAKFSPTIQIPIARGRKEDPARLRQRVVAATTSVRFEHGLPEPFAAFEARLRAVIAREANATGLTSRLLAATRAVPVPLAWKRKSISARRSHWLDGVADVIGGRAQISRIPLDIAAPAMCAVSSPARLASDADPIGSCVVTIIDDGDRGAITVCGSGFAGTPQRAMALVDELLATGANA